MNKKLLYIVIILLSFNKLQAQGTAGKDFWVAFMAQDWGCYYNSYYYNNDTAELFLSSQYNTTVYIAAKGQNFYDTLTLTPNITKMVSLPREVVCRYSDSVTTNGVHVYSDDIINVYAVNRYWYSKGATVVIPSSSIIQAPEYIITTNSDVYNWGWSCNGKNLQSPEFTIVGIADSSVIEIVPTGASSRSSIANVPFQITLKKGETFQYMTIDRDLTGSFVRSKYINSKFAVFAGNRQTYTNRVNSSSGNCYSSWDHTYEQLIPTVTWGRNYTSLPLKNNVKGYTLKVVAAENNTRININGSYYATLNQSGFLTYEVYDESVVRITGSNRISVAQFALGGYGCNNHPTKPYIGDPSQLQLFPDEQFGNNATINTVSQTPWWWNWNWYNWWWQQNSPEHFVNVMTKTTDTADFLFDNQKIAQSEWKTSSNLPDHHYAQIQMDTGSHYLNSSKSFLSYVYGYGYFDGYAYAAAAKFNPIQNNFLIINAQCVRDTVNFLAVVNDSFSNHYWRIQGKSGTVSGTKIKHKFSDTGWYEVKMYCQQVRTNLWDSVTKVLYVADTKIKSLLSSKDTLICDKIDIVEISKNFNIDNEYRWNDEWPVYYRAIKAPATYWLEVKERNGCVYRDSMIVRGGAYPNPKFTVSDTQFCFNANKTISFVNSSTSKDEVDFYRWTYSNRVDTVFSKDSIIKYKFPTATEYPVILRTYTKKGCYKDTSILINVLNSPKAKFSFTKKDTCFSTNGILLKNETVINALYHQRYRWRFSEGFNMSNTNPTTVRTYSDTGIYNVRLIYDNNNGCSDTMIQYVHVKPLPKVDFEYPTGVYCALDTIKLKSLTQTPYSPIVNTWKFSDNTSVQSLSANKVFTGMGTFNIKLISQTKDGCVDSSSQSIFINGTPIVNFNINNDTQCFVGHNFNFINSTNFNAKLNYEWLLGDNTTSNDSNVLNKTYSLDTVYKVTLKATTTVGCFNQNSKFVTIGRYPNAAFSINNQKQCLRSNSFNFTNNSNIKKGNIKNNFWNFGDGNQSILKDITNKKFINDDTFSVRLITESDLGCFDTISQDIVVHPQPKSNFTINQNTQCFNEHKFNYTNNSSIKNESLFYLWNLGDNTTSTDKDITKTYNSTGVYNIKLFVKSENNCLDTSNIQNITIHPSPAANFNISNDKQCFKNNLFNFIDNSTIASGNITNFNWKMGNQQNRSSKDVLNFVYYSEDTFKIQLVVNSNFNCRDTIIKNAITFAQPNLKFNIPNDTQCWQNNVFVMQNQTSLKYGQLFSNWDFGDNSTSNNYQPNEKIYPNTSGSYIVKYFANTEHNCKDSAIRRVTLLERPVANFAINDSIQCLKGNSFSFNNNTTFSEMNTLSYDWNYGNGVTSQGFLPQTILYNNADFYNVKLIVLSSLTNCYDTLISPLIVAPEPNPSFTFNNDSQCLRANYFEMTNTSTIQFGTMMHTWVLDNGTKTSSFNYNIRFNNESNKNIKLINESNYSCKDSITLPMGFFPTPIADFNINLMNQCLNNNSFDFTNTSSIAKGFTAQNWLASDGAQSNNLNWLNKNFNIHDTQWIRLSVVSNKNCTDTITKLVYLEKDKNINIAPKTNIEQCLRGNWYELEYVNLNPKVISVNNQWQYENSVYNDLNISQHRFTKEGQYSVLFTNLSSNNCLDSFYFELEVKPHPISNFNVDAVCFPEPSIFVNNSSIVSGNISNQTWHFGDGKTSKSQTPTNYYSNFGSYDVLLINESDFGCLDSILIQKAALVKEKPKAEFNYTKLSTINQDETRLQFNNLSSNIASNFEWFRNSNIESSEKNPLMLFQDTGSYLISLIAKSIEGCSDTISKKVGPVIPDFFFYLPNAFSPNIDIHNSTFKGIGSKFVFKYKMEIFNRWGEKIFESSDINKGWDGTYMGEPCMEGTYLCRVQIAPFNEAFRTYEQAVQLLR